MANIATQFLHEIPGHSSSDEVSSEPMAATVGCESILQPIGFRIMQAQTPCMLLD